MSNKNEVFEYLIDQLRQQVGNNPYKQQCEDLSHEVLSLKNQLRDVSAQIKELHMALAQATGDVEAYKLIRKGGYIRGGQNYVVGEHGPGASINCRCTQTPVPPEQSGCRKEDTQECLHNWRFVNGKAPAVCVNCGVAKSSECEHEWQFYGVGFPCMCLKCGLKK